MASHSPPLDALAVPSEDYHQVNSLVFSDMINLCFRIGRSFFRNPRFILHSSKIFILLIAFFVHFHKAFLSLFYFILFFLNVSSLCQFGDC